MDQHGIRCDNIELIFNYLQVAGLSLMNKSLNELYDTYIRTRVAVDEAMPDAQALIGLQQVQYRKSYESALRPICYLFRRNEVPRMSLNIHNYRCIQIAIICYLGYIQFPLFSSNYGSFISSFFLALR